MSIMSEEQALKLRKAGVAVPYVNETCIGCSACVAISCDVFELNDDGKSEVIARDDYQGLDVDDSISACPVNAISWRD